MSAKATIKANCKFVVYSFHRAPLFSTHQNRRRAGPNKIMTKEAAALRSLGYWIDWSFLEMCVSWLALLSPPDNNAGFDFTSDSD